jgi:nicotinamidase-related amidase
MRAVPFRAILASPGPGGKDDRLRGEAMNQKPGIWDASECALLLIDYQDDVVAQVFEQDRRVIELNAATLADLAVRWEIPVVLSTVGVEMGVNGPTIPSVKAKLPGVEEIDRSSTNAWEDPAFLAAVEATGRKRLVMAGIVTSVCLAFAAVSAIADGYEVMFVEDAVGDLTKEIHDQAALRLIQAGAVPNATTALMIEWFRDWKSPRASQMREVLPPYLVRWTALKGAPGFHEPTPPAARAGVD